MIVGMGRDGHEGIMLYRRGARGEQSPIDDVVVFVLVFDPRKTGIEGKSFLADMLRFVAPRFDHEKSGGWILCLVGLTATDADSKI
jgi:hypothetical protein